MADLTISVELDGSKVKGGAEETKRAVRGIADEAEKAAKKTSSLAKVDYSGAIRQLKEYGSQIKNVGSQVSGAGQSLTIGLTAPILGLALLIGGLGVTYESALNTFQAVTKATADEMRQASQVAKELGADVTLPATSAKDAALAMSELGKAGMTAAESMAAAKGVLQLAAAGQLDEAKAAEIAANALNAFNLKAEESVRVADLLAAASNASSAEVSDVAESYAQASATFAAAKVPIEDLTTAIAIMANAGIKGSDAGTSLKTFLSSIQAPSTAGASALKDLGIEIFDVEGKMKSLPEVIGLFEKSLAGLTDEKKVQAITDIFGADASRAAQILFRDGAAGFEAIKKAVTVTGAAADLAAAKTKGLGGAWESLKSQAETIGITIFDALKGPGEQGLRILGENLGKVSDYLSKLGQTNPEIIQMAAVFLAVVAAVGPLLIVLGTLITFLGSVVGAVATLLPIFTAVGGAIAGLGGFVISFIGLIGQAGLVASFSALATVLSSAIIPAIGSFLAALAPIAVGTAAIVAVVGVLIGVGVALYAAWQSNFGGLRDFTNEVFNQVSATVSAALTYIQEIWAANGSQIIATATNTFNSIIEFIRPIMTEIVSFMREAWQTIVAVAGPLFAQLVTLVKTHLTAMWVGIQVILGFISSLWKTHGEQIKSIVSAVWEIVKNIVLTGIRQIANVITLIVAVINGDWKQAWESFKAIIQAGINSSISILKSLGKLIVSAFAFAVTSVVGIGKAIVDGLINGIKSKASEAVSAAKDTITGVISVLRSVLIIRSPSRVTTEIGEFIGEGLAIGIENKSSRVLTAAKKIATDVIKQFQDAQKEFSKLAGASPETQAAIQQTNQTSDATSAQQEIVKLRGELGINNDLSLPGDVAGTMAELKYLQERKKLIEETIPPEEQLAKLSKETAEFRAKYAADVQKINDAITESGANELLQAQKEFDLLGVTNAVEKQRIENAYELLKLRQQMTNDGFGEANIAEAVELLRLEQARSLEWVRLKQLKQEQIDLDKKIHDDQLKAAEEAKKKFESDAAALAGSLSRIFGAGIKDGFKGFLKQTLEELKNFGTSLLNDVLGQISKSLSQFILGKLGGGSASGGSSSGGGGIFGFIRNLFGGGSGNRSSSGGGFDPISIIGSNGNRMAGAGGSTGFSSIFGSQGFGNNVGTYGAIGAGAGLLGGLIGGRVGGFISGAGSGLGIGASIGSMFAPGIGTAIGAGIGALAGGLLSLLGGDPKRKRDKNEKLPALNKNFADALAQLRSLGSDKNAFYNDPESVIAKAVELRGQIASGFGIQFESKKYGNQAKTLIAAKLAEADTIIADLNRLKERAMRARDVDSKLQTSFATGVYLGRDDQMREMQNFKRRNGMLAGNFNGMDTLPSMLARGEMVLNPRQIQQVIFNSNGNDPFRNAGIPGYANGAFMPSPSASSAPVASSNAPSGSQSMKLTLVIEGDDEVINRIKFKEALVDNLKKDDVQVELVKAVDKGRSRN